MGVRKGFQELLLPGARPSWCPETAGLRTEWLPSSRTAGAADSPPAAGLPPPAAAPSCSPRPPASAHPAPWPAAEKDAARRSAGSFKRAGWGPALASPAGGPTSAAGAAAREAGLEKGWATPGRGGGRGGGGCSSGTHAHLGAFPRLGWAGAGLAERPREKGSAPCLGPDAKPRLTPRAAFLGCWVKCSGRAGKGGPPIQPGTPIQRPFSLLLGVGKVGLCLGSEMQAVSCRG